MSALLAWPWLLGDGRLARSALHCLQHFVTKRCGRVGDPDAHGAHGFDLEFSGVIAARNYGAGMAHAAARRRGAAGDEADDRLLGAGRLQVLGALDLGVAADLA